MALRASENSITKRLTRMNMLVSGAALLLACSAFISYDVITFRNARETNLSIRAEIIGSNIASSLLFNDPHSAENTLAALKADPHVIGAGVYTSDGKLFAEYRRDLSPHDRALPPYIACEDRIEFDWLKRGRVIAVRTISLDRKLTGAVYILSDLEDLNASVTRYGAIALLILFASLVAAFLISWKSRQTIAEPIVRLAETARTVSREKNYSVRAPATRSRDELAVLIEAFNEMLAQIQGRDADLQTARDELEQRVQQRTAELENANKELEAFTYSVSHDLRAPLRHIDGFSKLLVDRQAAQLTEEAREYVTLIRDATREMGQLVDDLLNLARVGRKELSVQITGLDSLVQEVVADLKRDSASRTIDWKIDRLPFVECDPGLIKQVFANLLSNAVKFTRTRQKAEIVVGTARETGESVIFVRDNGVGFSMKHADKLFRVFQRLHRQEDFEGTGVGLATIQRIIKKHGGRIWVEAELDRGACFYFTLGKSQMAGSESGLPEGGQA